MMSRVVTAGLLCLVAGFPPLGQAAPLPLPLDQADVTRVVPPAENLSPEIQGLSGVFEGVWDSPVGSVPFRIIVERVDHLTAILRFGWGTDPSGECVFPREQMTGAQVSALPGDTYRLHWDHYGTRYSFEITIDAPTILAGEREGTGQITLRKIWPL